MEALDDLLAKTKKQLITSTLPKPPNHGNRVGSKFGGGVARASETNVHRRERLLKFALQAIDLVKDPYTTPKESFVLPPISLRETSIIPISLATQLTMPRTRMFLETGRPSYRVTKVRDKYASKEGIMVQAHLPRITADVVPRRRFMSSWEQKREPPNKAYYRRPIVDSCPAHEIEDEADDAGYWSWSH
ncbi:uncharacterized protein BJ212DRAFT_1295105 [Suillus subaureus]|uniref:SF3A2 domain-containing protein n=1 Tax=Suillus subaureus TaxID=48587 RepID=A0A9P7JJ78_9AGAM|nr:uncharacterized protein BJ212DRAFT_1295105 [Suillus subaureus]KAG1825732.1 hypothetical protein BJ212DRAFT_1295105 [Suillus subaureus]